MNVIDWLLWGLVATGILTALNMGSTQLGLTRMNLPYMLGSAFSPHRDRAKLYGSLVHMAIGLTFALGYVGIFESIGRANGWIGAALGLLHAMFVLLAGMPLLPAFHPRMAGEQFGPTATRQLEPPGFAALHYGVRTPVFLIASHLVYGAILGAFYRV